MKEIKFRAWDKERKIMFQWGELSMDNYGVFTSNDYSVDDNADYVLNQNAVPMQSTGLLDKNGIKELYEYDIIDKEGNLIGNVYENGDLLKEETNFTIQGFGTKDWCSTYKEAMERGCKNS